MFNGHLEQQKLLGVIEALIHHQADEKFNRADDADHAIGSLIGITDEENKSNHQQHDTAHD